jgi:hypothetical protein
MPLFKALAGPSPSCEAVLVQIEHWAPAAVASITNTKSVVIRFILKMLYGGKDTG